MGPGYVCPACSSVHADGEHLANHLAITAVLHGDEHDAWLGERVPDWHERDPPDLAAEVAEVAEETEQGATVGSDGGIGHGHVHGDHRRHEGQPRHDPEVRRIVEEAMEMTRERRGADRDG